MATILSPIPLTGVPFPRSEYASRQQKVFEAIETAKLDALVVTAHTHLQYLTGYDGAAGVFCTVPIDPRAWTRADFCYSRV
ncbi:aminopeptidase P family N-terminal domain-containing protein [Mesorhizobium sp. M0601]|uniref:aminopeptidase P family N-terminal domain-containing protein n=1 Tax=Mesorhizobium sp. M0601 TaxID=2956969 RepID=UPI003339DAB7